jgi:hypothetical protein
MTGAAKGSAGIGFGFVEASRKLAGEVWRAELGERDFGFGGLNSERAVRDALKKMGMELRDISEKYDMEFSPSDLSASEDVTSAAGARFDVPPPTVPSELVTAEIEPTPVATDLATDRLATDEAIPLAPIESTTDRAAVGVALPTPEVLLQRERVQARLPTGGPPRRSLSRTEHVVRARTV